MSRLILASLSPRRKELMTLAGYQFEVFVSKDKEEFHDKIPVREVAQHLAERKAQIALEHFKEEQVIIVAADTTVLLNEKIYNKPADEADAFRMLSELNGKMHEVITGVCIISNLHPQHLQEQRKISFSDITKVYFRKLTDEQLRFYISNYKPFDKAGSYGIQDWFGVRGVERIEGDYFNVMGLPVSRVAIELEKSGVR